MVEKLVVNVLSETVGVLAELTCGSAATIKLPTKAAQARALTFLNLMSPNPSLESSDSYSLLSLGIKNS
jgi:hypothetical protein